jgi:hypothetical protein
MSRAHYCWHTCPSCRREFETEFAAERFCSDRFYREWFGHDRPKRQQRTVVVSLSQEETHAAYGRNWEEHHPDRNEWFT